MKLIRQRLISGKLGDVAKLPAKDSEQLADLLGQLELIGVLVDRGLLDEKLVDAMFQSIPDTVELAMPYIKLRREAFQPDYAASRKSWLRRWLPPIPNDMDLSVVDPRGGARCTGWHGPPSS